MMLYLKNYFLFIKMSIPFCKPQHPLKTIYQSIFEGKADWFAKEQVKWIKMTPEQRQSWYESGEGRVIEFD